MNKCFGKILVFNVFFLSVLLFSGCGKITTESFEGIWIASHNTLNGNIYTGDLNLSVTEDGGFVLENSFKTVLMEGSLSVADDSILEILVKVKILCLLSAGCGEKDQYGFRFINEQVFVLEYEGNEIAFYKGDSADSTDSIEDSNWITGNGLNGEEIVYKVEISEKNWVSLFWKETKYQKSLRDEI
jgi:hypothetical protein